MYSANVSERRELPPHVGVSVVILSLGLSNTKRTSTQQEGTQSADSPRRSLWIPLVQRVRQPYLGDWALPGGQLRAGRSLEQSAYQALESTTQLRPDYLEQLYTFGDPERSRGGLPMVSIVYWALVSGLGPCDFESTDPHVAWFPVHNLPTLAFDHRLIIDYALQRLRIRASSPQIATRLIGQRFTLAQLHEVVEAITDQSINLANFRRKMLASGQLEDTGEKIRFGRQRPASLYRYRKAGNGEQQSSVNLTPWQGTSFEELSDAVVTYDTGDEHDSRRIDDDTDETLAVLMTTTHRGSSLTED